MENQSLELLIQSVVSDLELRGYSSGTIKLYQVVLGRLRRYAKSIKATEYTEHIGQQFIEFVKKCNPNMNKSTLIQYSISVQRVDCALNGKEWRYSSPANKKPYEKSCYDEIINEYENYLMQADKGERNVRRTIMIISDFMAFAERYGCSQINEINMEIVLAGFERTTCKDAFRHAVGAFLQYSYNRKMIKCNLRHLMPSIVRHHCVPSVYSPEEVEQLLASVDRETAIGKRNYAIILIAARLGLRTSDIVNLKFDNLTKERIEIIQFKTKKPLTTVLTDEIKDAISDYVDNGRPQISDPHIFLHKGGYGSVTPGAARRMTRRTFVKSGIICGNRKTGLHSLRASLATALLSEGNDYPTIQKVLGQEHIQSTRFYAKANVEQLRTHAIPVPPPTGNFAVLLKEGGV